MSETPSETELREAELRRFDRNARRRAQRLAQARFRMARHAAHQLVTYGPWNGDTPAATTADVISVTTSMYGNYRQIKGAPITEDEAAKALEAVLS